MKSVLLDFFDEISKVLKACLEFRYFMLSISKELALKGKDSP